MSFQEEKRESIKRYMLEKIRNDDEAYIQKTIENFGISVTTVKRYLKECLEKGILEEKESQTGYALACQEWFFSYDRKEGLQEDKLFVTDVRPALANLSNEANQIWYYVFSEIMNNAIDHSNAQHIYCKVKWDELYTEISITDDGIGIFANICASLSSDRGNDFDYYDAIAELYKGKFTTNSKEHSGEGIFFSSKLVDEFAIWSDNAIFYRGYGQKEKIVQSHLVSYYAKLKRIGTMVVMKLSNMTNRTVKEVFDMYAPIEEGFVKTVIPVKETCLYGEPIARSQARRLLYRLEQFKSVEFDFTDVEFVGQGFADEIFRVFQNAHPDIELFPSHANETVLGMIRHVRMNLE